MLSDQPIDKEFCWQRTFPSVYSVKKKILKFYEPTFWTNDGKTFVQKLDPEDQARAPGARIWWQKDEGLNFGLYDQGKKNLKSWETCLFFVAVSYTKGVVLCEHCEHLDGPFFAKFMKKHFVKVFNRSDIPGKISSFRMVTHLKFASWQNYHVACKCSAI